MWKECITTGYTLPNETITAWITEAIQKLDEQLTIQRDTTARDHKRSAKKILPAGLTAREADILRLLSAGMTDAQIAENLFISPRTVNAHLTSVYSKLGVNSRAAATRFALENGMA